MLSLIHISDDLNLPVREQSEQAFRKVEEILKAEQMNFGDIVRQWNYLERITDITHGNQCYQDFNDVRTLFYASSAWESGLSLIHILCRIFTKVTD